jgi:hypothetical protein
MELIDANFSVRSVSYHDSIPLVLPEFHVKLWNLRMLMKITLTSENSVWTKTFGRRFKWNPYKSHTYVMRIAIWTCYERCLRTCLRLPRLTGPVRSLHGLYVWMCRAVQCAPFVFMVKNATQQVRMGPLATVWCNRFSMSRFLLFHSIILCISSFTAQTALGVRSLQRSGNYVYRLL